MPARPPVIEPPAAPRARGVFAGLPPGTVRLIQITDPHLYADPAATLLGIDTLASLDAVLRLIREEALPADALLATGDLVHDGSAAGYARLRERLAATVRPAYALPGNHDDPAAMAAALREPPVTACRHVRFGDWSLVLLDSTTPGEDGGFLTAGELAALDEHLRTGARHAVVCLHHPPLPIGSAWLDDMALANADALLAIVDRHPSVRGVVFGHIHQPFDATRGGVRLLGTPSTCVQFAEVRPRFGVDTQPAGYRWLGLLPDGGIATGVRRLPAPASAVQLDAAGY
jgi:Icc protein